MGSGPPPHAQRPVLLWIAEVARLFLGFAVVALLAHTVSPAELGTYLSITSVTLIVPRLLDCGLPHAFGYFLRVEPARLRAATTVLAKHVLFMAPVAFAVTFALQYVPFANGSATGITQQHWPELGVLVLSELAILLGLASYIPTGHFKAYLATAIISPSSLLLLVALWPRHDLIAGRLLDLLLVGSLFGSLTVAMALARATRGLRPTPFPIGAAYSYGLRSYGSALTKVAAQRFDRLFLVTVLGAAGYAQYSLAISIRDMATVPSNLHAMTLRNQQIDLMARTSQHAVARSVLLNVSLLWLVLGVGGATILYPFWSTLVPLVFGVKYAESAAFVQVVAFSCAPLAIMGFAWNHLYAMRFPGRVTVLTSVSLLLALPTFALFIKLRGPTAGVALAVVIWSAAAAAASLAWALSSRPPPRANVDAS